MSKVQYDNKKQYERINAYVIPGETLHAVFDCKGTGTGFVGADLLDPRVAVAYGRSMAHELEQRVLASYLDENDLKRAILDLKGQVG